MSHTDLTNTEFTTLNPVGKRVFRGSLYRIPTHKSNLLNELYEKSDESGSSIKRFKISYCYYVFTYIWGTTLTLRSELSAWEIAGYKTQKSIDWQFTADGARIKFKRLYPNI
jgi:hypothetical protein